MNLKVREALPHKGLHKADVGELGPVVARVDHGKPLRVRIDRGVVVEVAGDKDVGAFCERVRDRHLARPGAHRRLPDKPLCISVHPDRREIRRCPHLLRKRPQRHRLRERPDPAVADPRMPRLREHLRVRKPEIQRI